MSQNAMFPLYRIFRFTIAIPITCMSKCKWSRIITFPFASVLKKPGEFSLECIRLWTHFTLFIIQDRMSKYMNFHQYLYRNSYFSILLMLWGHPDSRFRIQALDPSIFHILTWTFHVWLSPYRFVKIKANEEKNGWLNKQCNKTYG